MVSSNQKKNGGFHPQKIYGLPLSESLAEYAFGIECRRVLPSCSS